MAQPGRSMEIRMQNGSANPKNRIGTVIVLLFVALLVWIAVSVVGHHDRHKHLTKLVKTKNHRIYAENHDGSCYEFVDSGGSYASDIGLPKSGSSSFKLPSGSWVKASPPKEEEIAEEEEAAVEESDGGQPEADAEGDVGADSDGSAAADSGGDSGSGGGDSGGGDGGGGDD